MSNLQILNVQQSIHVLYRINDLVWALIENDTIFIRFLITVTAWYWSKVFQSPLSPVNTNNNNNKYTYLQHSYLQPNSLKV